MKNVLLILALIISGNIYAQDQIVTIHSDTLSCTITKMKNGYVYFNFRGNDSTQVFNSVMPIDQIQSIESKTFAAMEEENAEVYPKTWLRIKGGYSRRIAKIPENALNSQKDYYNELRNGYCFGAEFTYFLDQTSGLGLKYSLHRSKASEVVKVGTIGYMPFYDKVQDNISIHYIALTYTIRFLSDNNCNVAYLCSSFGLVNYKNAAFIPKSAVIKAQTLGLSFDFGYDIVMSENTAFSLGIGLSTGYYDKFTITNSNGKTSEEEFERGKGDNLARLNLTIGLVFK